MSANTVERLNVFHFLDYTIWKLFQVGIWEPFTNAFWPKSQVDDIAATNASKMAADDDFDDDDASDVDERDDDEEISVT